MIVVAGVLLALSAIAFAYRLVVGPTLADRMVGVDGMIVCGTCAIVVTAAHTGDGAFLPAAVVLAAVSFIGTSVIARFIERRGR